MIDELLVWSFKGLDVADDLVHAALGWGCATPYVCGVWWVGGGGRLEPNKAIFIRNLLPTNTHSDAVTFVGLALQALGT